MLFLQFYTIPRYFMFIWLCTGFGKIFPNPVKHIIGKIFFDDNTSLKNFKNTDFDIPMEKQLTAMMYLCDDTLSG